MKTKGVMVYLPLEVLAAVDLRLFDPVRGKILYRARSALVTALLEKWLLEQRKEGTPNG